MQKDIAAVIGETIVIERLQKLVHKASLERIQYHLEHWHIHKQNQTKTGAGYFLTVVENDIQPVSSQRKPYATNKISQRDNFDQRGYSDEELERFYANLAEEESTPPVSVVPLLELPVCELLPNPFIDTPAQDFEGES